MKPLELTEDQKAKLLEMCEKLFPEHKWGFGSFYSGDEGIDSTGLDFLDITHINHKIPRIVYRDQVKGDPSNLEIVEKDQDDSCYDQVIDGYLDNISGKNNSFQAIFKDGKISGVKEFGWCSQKYVEGIHWFEFCTTILPTKLYPLYDRFVNDTGPDFHEEMLVMCLVKGEHPVDYLYEQFSQLKPLNK